MSEPAGPSTADPQAPSRGGVGAGVFAATPPLHLAQAAGNPASPKVPIPLYFINAPLDYALVGLLSIIAFTILYSADKTERTAFIVLLAAKLAWVCNWPHFAATSYRLYQSKDNIRQYPL